MKTDQKTYDMAIEAAAQILYLCLCLSIKWRNGSPPHRDKAIIMYACKVTDGLIGDGAGREVLGFIKSGFKEAQQVVKKSEEVAF